MTGVKKLKILLSLSVFKITSIPIPFGSPHEIPTIGQGLLFIYIIL